MSVGEPPNNVAWRVTVLERQVEALQAGQPAVVADRVTRLSNDVDALRREVQGDMSSLRDEIQKGDKAQQDQIASFRRVFVTTFSGLGVVIAGAVVALIITGGGSP